MVTNVKFLSKKKLKNPVLFVGLPGIGLVGKICVDYLLKQFKTEKIAEIYSDSFPPSVHTRDAILELIKDTLYVSEFKGKHFLFLAGPVQPTLDFRLGSAAEHYEFALKIVEAVKSLGVKKIYTLAGINIGNKRLERQPQVVVAATSKNMLDDLKKYGVRVDSKEGLISGAAGLILGIAKEHKIDGACIMGETNAQLVYGDHGAAKKIIEVLVKKFGFKVDMSKIERESKNIEEAFTQLAKQLEASEEDEEKPSSLTYVR